MFSAQSAAVAREVLLHGAIASRHTLLRAGYTPQAIDRARAEKLIVTIRRGVYASYGADIDQRRAVRMGARIGCVSALRRFGVWGGLDPRLHVHVEAGSNGLHIAEVSQLGRDRQVARSDKDFYAEGGPPRVHWQNAGRTMALNSGRNDSDWLAPPLLALRQAVLCQDEEHSIASIDSAIRKRYIRGNDLDVLFQSLPQRLQRLRAELDPLADSGTESIFRVRLRRLGHKVEPQRDVPGSSKFDALIDDVVAVDLDSRRWHGDEAQQEWDYDKTLLSFLWGRPALRIRPHHLFEKWPETLQVIERTIEDARDLRRYRGLG